MWDPTLKLKIKVGESPSDEMMNPSESEPHTCCVLPSPLSICLSLHPSPLVSSSWLFGDGAAMKGRHYEEVLGAKATGAIRACELAAVTRQPLNEDDISETRSALWSA